MLVPSHSIDPDAGPLASFTCNPPNAAPVPFTANILSPKSIVVESIVVVLPCTSKFPVRVNPTNVGESPACNPVSISVLAPLIVALTVPWEGEVNAEAETVLSGNAATTAASNPVILPAEVDPDTICPPLATTMLPEVEESNVTVAVLSFVRVTLAGSINTSLLLYTVTVTFLLAKLWVTATDVWLVKLLAIVAAWFTVIPDRLEPSPWKDPEKLPELAAAISDAIEALNEVDEPEMSEAICAEEDSAPVNVPVIAPSTASELNSPADPLNIIFFQAIIILFYFYYSTYINTSPLSIKMFPSFW